MKLIFLYVFFTKLYDKSDIFSPTICFFVCGVPKEF